MFTARYGLKLSAIQVNPGVLVITQLPNVPHTGTLPRNCLGQAFDLAAERGYADRVSGTVQLLTSRTLPFTSLHNEASQIILTFQAVVQSSMP